MELHFLLVWSCITYWLNFRINDANHNQGTVIRVVVQAYFALRVYQMTKKNWFVLLPLWVCIVTGLGSGIAVVSTRDYASDFVL
jgi:hypothetical protein